MTPVGFSRAALPEGAAACPQAIRSDSPEGATWYALRTRSHFEFVVADVLRARFCEAFLPFCLRRCRLHGALQMRPRPLFPGYVFVRSTRTALRDEALRIHGVTGVVSRGPVPEPIADEIIGPLRQIAQADPARIAPAVWRAGEPVTVTRGPFAGLAGVIDRAKGAERLVILTGFLGRACAVEVGEAELYRASSPAGAAAA